jgi:hypothetical protein
MNNSKIMINGAYATVDAATAATVRFAARQFARMGSAKRLCVVEAAANYFAAIKAGEDSRYELGRFEGLMGFHNRDEIQIQWVMDYLLDWFEDGYSYSANGDQRR